MSTKVTIETLREGAIYRTPTGRLCTVARFPRGRPTWGENLTFRYVDDTAEMDDSFTLHRANLSLLREDAK